MKSKILTCAIVFAVTETCALAQFRAPPPPPTPVIQQNIEVQARGPVHEAFAEPIQLQAEAGLLVSKAPPPPIQEVPPPERPVGDFMWIPGYWSWDADRNDFLWVSACW